jgi:8-hydroxy-5-deazaflavin:NADPH oxidoreductase
VTSAAAQFNEKEWLQSRGQSKDRKYPMVSCDHKTNKRKIKYMNIGIIGSGNIGSILAKRFALLGHNVSIANSRGPESLVAFAAEMGVTPVSVEQAVRGKHMVVIAITEQGILNLPRDLFAEDTGETIVVDTGNYYPEVRDTSIAEIDEGMLESDWVSQRFAIPIIKAFNNMTVWSLTTRGLPTGTPGRICLSVAGDSSKNKQVILELIDQIGFDGIDAGALADSWRQQPGTPAYCMDLDAAGLNAALAKANRAKIAEYRMNAITEAKRAVAEAGSLDAAAANAGRPGK